MASVSSWFTASNPSYDIAEITHRYTPEGLQGKSLMELLSILFERLPNRYFIVPSGYYNRLRPEEHPRTMRMTIAGMSGDKSNAIRLILELQDEGYELPLKSSAGV